VTHEKREKGNPLLTSIVISPQADCTGDLSANITKLGHVRVLRSFQRYPSAEEMGHFLQTSCPAIVFLGAEDTPRALELALAIDRTGTGAQVVVVSSNCDPQFLVASMQVGIREFLSLPIDLDRLNETVGRIADVLERKPLAFRSTDAVFSFLPAKAGDGASTVALNVASAIARSCPGKTLLADFDLTQGMISFLLKISNSHSVIDALGVADHLDETLWRNLVMERDNLDILCSGRFDPTSAADLSLADQVLTFAKRSYSTICLDLSGAMEPFSMPLLGQSREIFLISTSDVASLHFARSKAQFLRESGFADRASVILNRSGMSSAFSIDELEKVLGLRIRFVFQNDPRRIGNAMSSGTSVDAKSVLGRQFETFAKSIAGIETNDAPTNRKRRFIEYFAIVPTAHPDQRAKRR
jgi:pilus assembly protein CpaE